jgi:endonuclease YncB( thermonuclease family)
MGKSIILESIKDRSEKYGRILGTIYLETTTLNEGIKTVTYVNINQKMVASGFAESYLI